MATCRDGPSIGRFLQPDIGFIDGMNLYTYCGNNPIMWLDPWGLCKEKDKYDETSEDPMQAWYKPGKTPPTSWPNPGKGWKWDPEGYYKNRGQRKHYHPPDNKHKEPHWDVENRKGRRTGRETIKEITGNVIGYIGTVVTTTGQVVVDTGKWISENPGATVVVVGGVAVVVFDMATFPSGEGTVGVIMIQQAIGH